MVPVDVLAHAFVHSADTLADTFDLKDYLRAISEKAAMLSGESSAGILLADQDDVLQHVAASSASAENLELLQIRHSDGPSLDCYRGRNPVMIHDLRETTRWPRFVRHAVEAGVLSVQSFPMRHGNRMIGSLNIFGGEALKPESVDVNVVQALADVTTIAILQQRAHADAKLRTEQLQQALDSRVVIEQAKGVISREHGVSVDEAFVALRSHAREKQVRLADLAHRIVSRMGHPPRGND